MSFDRICIYNTHHSKQLAPTHVPHTDCSGRAQAQTRPALGQKLSQHRRGDESDSMEERSGAVDSSCRRPLLLVSLLLL